MPCLSATSRPRGPCRPLAGVAEVGYGFAGTVSANGTPELNPNDAIRLQAGVTF